MSFRRWVLSALLAATFTAGCLAVTSPAWAVGTGGNAASGCVLVAGEPTSNRTTVTGDGSRGGCSDIVTYFWVRVYKVIPMWPDVEKAVRGSTYVQNMDLSASGQCDGRGAYYTHTSTATGISGDSVESSRAQLC